MVTFCSLDAIYSARQSYLIQGLSRVARGSGGALRWRQVATSDGVQQKRSIILSFFTLATFLQEEPYSSTCVYIYICSGKNIIPQI